MHNGRHDCCERLCTLDIYAKKPTLLILSNGEVKNGGDSNKFMLFSPALFEVGFATLAALPYAKHGFDLLMARKRTLSRPNESYTGTLTILLPIWNEANILTQKLNNLKETCQTFKPHIVIIDSASTDQSVSIAEQWEDKGAFATYELLKMEERQGKTAAVKKALEHINRSIKTDLVLMTDADAMFESNTVPKLLQWFAEPSIGCVGATPKRIGQRVEEEGHRNLFSMVRNLESKIDSTPFLEGSCMVWRTEALDVHALNETSNADDAQIATNIRINGLRVIQDDDAHFIDHAPLERKEHSRQKVRRAQGLQRHLLRQRQHWFNRRHGKFAAILRQEAALHLLTPLLLVCTMVAMLARWALIGFAEVDFSNATLTTLHVGLFAVEACVLLSWFTVRFGIKIPVLNQLGSIVDSNIHLVRSLWNSSRGTSLHMWDQHLDGRN
jgi:cellulose synthase/poly-beta-1,6-N-acetylglucosamine synthase-like glycosyltransferase